MIAPQLAAGAVLAWARALGEFGATITFAGNLAGRTQTLPLAVYQARQTDPGGAVLLSLILVALSLVGAGRASRGRLAEPDEARGCRSMSDLACARGAFDRRAAFDVEDGETVALLGPERRRQEHRASRRSRGSCRWTRGRVALDGVARSTRSAGAATDRDGVPGRAALPASSALENVAFPLRARGAPRPTRRETSALATPRRPGARRSARREAGEPLRR